MAQERVDFIKAKQQELFSDFVGNFDKHPITGDLARVTNESAIKQSLKNIILTNYGERPFQPFLGSSVKRSLFEPLDIASINDLKLSIERSIDFMEPRVRFLSVNVYPNNDQQSVAINLVFLIINTSQQSSLDLTLTRVR